MACIPPSTVVRPSGFQQALLDNLDFLLPQRELAPCRRAVSPQFTRDIMKTPNGLFSILIFRLIAYRTQPFLTMPDLERRVVFNSLEDWEIYLEQLKERFGEQPLDCYCNWRAFEGQTQTGRVLENAALYWDVAEHCAWSKHFVGNNQLLFKECMKVLSKLKTSDKKGVPQLGPLAQFFITDDLVYAGLVTLPTPEELAPYLQKLNAGGVKGLRMLEYCSSSSCNSKPPLEKLVPAFLAFYNDIDARLSTEEKSAMGWDTLVAEHMLCKMTRVKKHWVTL